jgi:alkaline phosphatase D
LQGAVNRRVSGLVAVTGDIHRAIAGNLMLDFDKPGAAPIGVEFVASSISSDGDGGRARKAAARLMANNPHLRFYDGRRGSLICEFDEQRCQATYRAVDVVSTRGGKVSTARTFTVEAKQPGLG